MIDFETPKTAHPSAHDAEAHDAGETSIAFRPARTSTVIAIASGVAIVLGALFTLGVIPLRRKQHELLAQTEPSARPQVVVSVTHPRRSAPTTELTLPGTVRPFQDTAIYARTNGYLKKWHVDIGDRVGAGQLLAEIEVPELDQQIDQARASLNQVKARLALAQANVALAESTLKRYENAAPAGGITAQELDEKRASLEVSRATVAASRADVEAADANVRRLVQLKDFAAVAAPFSGTITARMVELGTLITAGNAKGQELFHLAQTNPARVFVSVPQVSAPSIREGTTAEVFVREHPNHRFLGEVARTTRSIDDMSRTLLADVEIPNEDALLLPGMYTQVKFQIEQPRTCFFVPQGALVVTADGTQVITVGEGEKLHYQDVTVDTDYGTEVALASGVTEKDRVVTNPGEKLVEGLVVRVSAPAETASAKK